MLLMGQELGDDILMTFWIPRGHWPWSFKQPTSILFFPSYDYCYSFRRESPSHIQIHSCSFSSTITSLTLLSVNDDEGNAGLQPTRTGKRYVWAKFDGFWAITDDWSQWFIELEGSFIWALLHGAHCIEIEPEGSWPH